MRHERQRQREREREREADRDRETDREKQSERERESEPNTFSGAPDGSSLALRTASVQPHVSESAQTVIDSSAGWQ